MLIFVSWFVMPIGYKVEEMAANGASAFRQLLNLGVVGRSDDSINRNNMKKRAAI